MIIVAVMYICIQIKSLPFEGCFFHGGSDDGGLDELDEFVFNRASSLAIFSLSSLISASREDTADRSSRISLSRIFENC